MHDTAPNGGVTSSPPNAPDDRADHAAHERQHDDGQEVQMQSAALKRRDLGRRVVGDPEQQPEHGTGPKSRDHGRTEREEPAAVKGQAGDVDGNGDVVDELGLRLRRKVAAARLILLVGDAPARARVLDEAEALLDELVGALDDTYVPLSTVSR